MLKEKDHRMKIGRKIVGYDLDSWRQKKHWRDPRRCAMIRTPWHQTHGSHPLEYVLPICNYSIFP